MKRALVLGLAAAIGVLWACGSSSSDAPPDDFDAATAVSPTYCAQYCQAQANAGTLQGSREACMSKCCGDVPEGCGSLEAGTTGDGGPDPTDGGVDTGVDACAKPCGNDCCTGKTACGEDATGKPVCVATCVKGSDCSSGCCAPATNPAGDPIGPYVCKPNDGKPYHCCAGITVNCSSPECCVQDSNGNEFCAKKCDSNTQCGAAQCIGYNFSIVRTTCQGPTACGP